MNVTKLLFALTLVLPLAAAQKREKIPPPTFERVCVVDEAGFKQWAKLEQKCEECHGRGKRTCQGCEGRELPACTECDGTKTAPCRTCGGGKVLPDPIIEIGCPFCKASGWYDCGQCAGNGSYFETKGEQRTELPCRACDKKGRYKCTPCGGKRLVPTVRFKKTPPGEAKLKDLVKMREVVTECLKALEEFEPGENGRKSLKGIKALFKKPKRKLPILKDVVELLGTALSGISRVGAGYENFEARNTHQILLFKDRTVYYLQHQARVIDQCTARLEHNAKVEAGE